MQRLAAAPRQALIYPGAGCGVGTVPYLPAGTTLPTGTPLGGTPEANAAARADGSPKVLEWLFTNSGTARAG